MKSANPTQHLIKPSDLWFAGGLLLAAAVLAFLMWSQPQGTQVVFRQDGEIVGTYSLSSDAEIRIDGNYTNVFEISGGQVRVVETSCPNGACMDAGAVSSAGTSIICAPNHVSATVEGNGGLDAFTG